MFIIKWQVLYSTPVWCSILYANFIPYSLPVSGPIYYDTICSQYLVLVVWYQTLSVLNVCLAFVIRHYLYSEPVWRLISDTICTQCMFGVCYQALSVLNVCLAFDIRHYLYSMSVWRLISDTIYTQSLFGVWYQTLSVLNVCLAFDIRHYLYSMPVWRLMVDTIYTQCLFGVWW